MPRRITGNCAHHQRMLTHSIKRARNIALLSFGTGEDRTPLHYKEFKDRGILRWLKPLIDLMMDGSMMIADYELRTLFEDANVSDQYLRLETSLENASPNMDNVQPENIKALHKLALKKGNSEAAQAQMDTFIDFLEEEVSKEVTS